MLSALAPSTVVTNHASTDVLDVAQKSQFRFSVCHEKVLRVTVSFTVLFTPIKCKRRVNEPSYFDGVTGERYAAGTGEAR